MLDFLIMYEVKQREIENIILIGSELKKRGYSVEYCSFSQIDDKKKVNKYFNNVKAILMPSLYHNEEVMNIVYHVAGKVKKIVNLQWEQVLTVKAEEDKMSYMFPKDCAKNAIHLCWGEKPAENFKSAGISDDRIFITGPIHMDFLRPNFKEYYLSKEDLIKKYSLDPEKKNILFISSFVFSNMTKWELKATANAWGDEWVKAQRDLATHSFDNLIEWVDRLLSRKKDINFIYRPHPVENGNNKLKEMQNKYENFYVISEGSVKQWILFSDKIFTWISTSIAEAFFAKKQCSIIRPVPIPKQQEMTILNNAKHIDSYEKFILSFDNNSEESIDGEIINSYYNVDEDKPSYLRVCDVLQLVLNDEKYDFIWDDKLIDEYENSRAKRLFKSIIQKNYKVALKIALLLQEKLSVSFGSTINRRIDSYKKDIIKKNENIVSEHDITFITRKIQNSTFLS